MTDIGPNRHYQLAMYSQLTVHSPIMMQGKGYLLANRLTAFAIIILFLTKGNVFAQPADNVEQVPEVVVTGTIIDTEAVFGSIPKQSLDADDIGVLHPATVIDVLKLIPGLDVSQQGGEGGLTFISIRGGDPNFTVVMIDGVKADDPTNSRGGGFDFSGLDPLIIEHIDVYFGSHSAVYGSDALGGVISVTTKSATSTLNRSGTLEADTGGGWAGTLHLSGPLNGAITGSIAAVTRQGSVAVAGDSIERQQLAVKLTNSPASVADLNWRLNFFISTADTTSFPIASGGNQLALIREVEQRDFDQYIAVSNIGWSPLQNWQTKLVAGWTRYKEQNNSPGIAPGILSGIPPVTTKSDYERANVIFSNTLSLSNEVILGIGAEGIHEKGEIDSLIDLGFPVPANFSQTRDTWALFGEAAVSLGKQFTLITSLRHDDMENITSTNGRIAANIDFTLTNTAATLSYAEGFKLPSLFALGHSLTGNSNLQPEQSKSYSLTVQQPIAHQRATLSFNLYYNEFKDLVDFDAMMFSHVNRSSVTAKGMDLSVRADFSSTLRLNGSVGYLNTKSSGGARLERRPKWKGGLTLTWEPADAWLFSIEGHIKDDFYDNSVPTGQILLDGYTRFDAGIQWRLTEKIDVKLRIDNLFDNDYEEVVGFSAVGRQARLALSVRL